MTTTSYIKYVTFQVSVENGMFELAAARNQHSVNLEIPTVGLHLLPLYQPSRWAMHARQPCGDPVI